MARSAAERAQGLRLKSAGPRAAAGSRTSAAAEVARRGTAERVGDRPADGTRGQRDSTAGDAGRGTAGDGGAGRPAGGGRDVPAGGGRDVPAVPTATRPDAAAPKRLGRGSDGRPTGAAGPRQSNSPGPAQTSGSPRRPRPPSSSQAGTGRDRSDRDARAYDPRRDARRQLTRVPLPDDVDARTLDPEVRQDLRPLSRDAAELVARHLVMAGRLLDDDPTQALAHARAAGALAGRIGAVREAVGLAAYAASQWTEALAELRTARRITGRADHLAVIADCERALGRPERALAVADDRDVPRLDQAGRVELAIVVAGARRDLGQPDAAVVLLQGPARATTARRPWATRLWYAYADALLAAGRETEAREWFAKAAEHDGQGETDALERLLELDGVVFDDLLQGDDPLDGDALDVAEHDPVDLAALLAAPGTAVRNAGLQGDDGQEGRAAADALGGSARTSDSASVPDRTPEPSTGSAPPVPFLPAAPTPGGR